MSGCSALLFQLQIHHCSSSPAFSRGPDADSQVGFSLVKSASPHLDTRTLSHFWALVSLKPVLLRVWSLDWLAEQHCLSLYPDSSFRLPDCSFPLHVHLLESRPSLCSDATSSRKSPWLGAVLLIAPVLAFSRPLRQHRQISVYWKQMGVFCTYSREAQQMPWSL